MWEGERVFWKSIQRLRRAGYPSAQTLPQETRKAEGQGRRDTEIGKSGGHHGSENVPGAGTERSAGGEREGHAPTEG